MSQQAESPAVAFVRRHMEAYSNGDLATARGNVADDVVADTNDVHLDGIEAYMAGLTRSRPSSTPAACASWPPAATSTRRSS